MDPIFLQKQLRENAADLQDFCKDLKNWGESMKRKEESLKKYESEKTTSGVKERKISKAGKIATQKKNKTEKVPRRIGTTDYGAWEKFDADAECEKLDDLNYDSELTDECNENLQDQAIVEKEKGNKFVHNQNWDEAIKCYTRAIECFSYDPVFYANRALCYLKKGNFEETERDCTLSLKLDDTYVKAYQRRAAAREGLNKIEDAERDLLRALELEPKNKECKISLEKVRKLLGRVEKPPEQRPVSRFTASRNKSYATSKPNSSLLTTAARLDDGTTETKKNVDTSKPTSVWPTQSNIIIVKPINKPPHLRSQKPLKRIEIIDKDNNITECGINVNVKSMETAEPEAIKKHVLENKVIQDIAKELPGPVSAFKKRQLEKCDEKTNDFTALPRADQHIVCLKSDELKVIENKNSENFSRVMSNISKEVKNTSNITLSTNGTQKYIEGDKTNVKFVIPKTSVQFYSTWKNLKTTGDKYKYIKSIPPQDLPIIFQQSLESSIFSNILEVLVKHYIENKDCVFNVLDNLTKVKRFGTFTLFMTTTDKSNLWKLLDYIKEAEQKSKDDVDQLIQKYEL